MQSVWIVPDFETASLADLKACGADRYAEDPSTEVLWLSWEFEDGRQGGWTPSLGMACPAEIVEAILRGDEFVAHSARFERAIWREIMVKQFHWPAIPLEQWHDTLARCAELVLPLDLDKVAKVLELPMQKDLEGRRITLGLSKPDKFGNLPPRTPALMRRVGLYCDSDIGTQAALHRRLGWLDAPERQVWLMDQRINDRGVRLDMPLVKAMRTLVDKATEPLAQEFRTLTGGLDFTQVGKVGDWVRARGVDLPNFQKETIADALGKDIDHDDESNADDGAPIPQGYGDLPAEVRRALSIRQLVGSASIKKLGAMEACVCADSRAHGLLQYHAAGPGRWGGRIIQPQNFPRGTTRVHHGLKPDGSPDLRPPNLGELIDVLLTADPALVEMLYGPPVETVLSALRNTLVPGPGRAFVAGDFSQIEARICLAIAGQWDKVDLLARKLDPYCDMATSIYGRTITKADVEERQIGKNSVLGLGFGMGWWKFQLKYAPLMSKEFCRGVVSTYRTEWAPEVPKLWKALDRAALDTVMAGTPHSAAGVLYALEDRWLTARLPSGRKLWYFNPQARRRRMPWSTEEEPDVRWGWTYQAKKAGKWLTIDAFGGLLCENICQALARDLLVAAMFKCEAEDIPIVLTVHDEIVGEPEERRQDAATVLEQIMIDIPDWARYLRIPVAAECWLGDRYRK